MPRKAKLRYLQNNFLWVRIYGMATTTRPRGRPPRTPQPPTDAVRRLRLELGKTQVQLAKMMHCSENSIARYERDHTTPEVFTVRAQFEKLARKAGISLEAE